MHSLVYKRYFPHLNATRFFAFVLVFLTHCFYSNDEAILHSAPYQFVRRHLELGLLGLDYFFVLSSFLISWIIYEEQKFTQKFSLLNFYVRRSLRIFPLYFFVVILGFLVVWSLHNFTRQVTEPLPSFYYFGLFILNFYMIDHGFNFLFFLTFFWSVSVEEQFYLGWAVLNKYFLKYAHLVAFVFIFLSLAFRAANLDDNNKLVFHTISSLGNFGVGCLLSYFFFNYKSATRYLNSVNKYIRLSAYFLCFLLMLYYPILFSSNMMIVFERLIFAVLFAAIIADFSFATYPVFNLEKYKLLSYFGQLSFGLYCYHGIVMTILLKVSNYYKLDNHAIAVFFVLPIIAFISTLILAHLSYKYFEHPFARLKENFM